MNLLNGCKKRFTITGTHWIIALLCIGFLFTHPVSVEVEDSQYLWHKYPGYNDPILSGLDGFHFYTEPIEGIELVVFSENGVLKALRETTAWEERPSEDRFSFERLFVERPDVATSSFSLPIIWYPRYDLVWDENNNVNEHKSETFCDYLGVIVKKGRFDRFFLFV